MGTHKLRPTGVYLSKFKVGQIVRYKDILCKITNVDAFGKFTLAALFPEENGKLDNHLYFYDIYRPVYTKDLVIDNAANILYGSK